MKVSETALPAVYVIEPRLAITWPVSAPQLSEKDSVHPGLDTIPLEQLPRFGVEA
jgi:dTDP-4-dehydrorhamnose 3,5-epimerase-like enzyme